MKKIKIGLFIVFTLFIALGCPRSSFGDTDTSQEYIVNGIIYERDNISDDNRLILHNGNESLTLNRDGMHWYSNNGEVTPEPYTKESSSTSSVESSLSATESSTTTIETTSQEPTSHELVKKQEPQTDDSVPSTTQSTDSVKSATTAEPQKESTVISKSNIPAETTVQSQSPSVTHSEKNVAQKTAAPVFSDKKLLPKTGSSTFQNRCLTVLGMVLSIIALCLFKINKRHLLGGKNE